MAEPRSGISIDATGRPRILAWATEEEIRWVEDFREKHGLFTPLQEALRRSSLPAEGEK